MAIVIDIKNAIRGAIYLKDNEINFFFNEIKKVEYPYIFFYIPSFKLPCQIDSNHWQKVNLMCVVEYAKSLKPSARGELEITDLNRIYLEQGNLNVELLGQGFTWLDTGTHESLVDATNFVMTVEKHQHRKIACLEEIAYLNGWISKDDVLKVYEVLKKNQYGQYLKDVLDGKYMDALR